MSYLGIDLETFSAADLKAVGAHRYAEDPSFEVLLFGFAFDDDDPTVIDLTAHEPIPKDVLDALRLNGIIKSGWNIAFERTCLARHLGFDQPAGQWEDTMVLASVCGLPMGLGDCGAALHMSADKAKDKDGKALIRWFCKPCKPTKTRPDRTRHMPEDYPEKWSRFVAYNGQDVVAERAIRKTLAQWAPTGVERKIWAVDQQINDRGIRVDLTLANAAREMDRAYDADSWVLRLDAARSELGLDPEDYFIAKALSKQNGSSIREAALSAGFDPATTAAIIATDFSAQGSFTDPYTPGYEYVLSSAQKERYESMFREKFVTAYTDYGLEGLTGTELSDEVSDLVSEVNAEVKREMSDWLYGQGISPTQKK